MWEAPTMTVIADSRKRVILKPAKPGDRFDVQITGDGKVILTPLGPVEKEVPVVKPVRTKEGWLMFPPGKHPSRQAIRDAIRENRDRFLS
jgi:hypothetical protein